MTACEWQAVSRDRNARYNRFVRPFWVRQKNGWPLIRQAFA
jgi:hypothetical protein